MYRHRSTVRRMLVVLVEALGSVAEFQCLGMTLLS